MIKEKTEEWPFDDPKNVAVFTVRSVWEKKRDILYVYHNSEDGAWQFHADKNPEEKDASIISLEEVVELDNSIKELADLPYDWRAWRKDKQSPWIKEIDKN